MAINFPSNPTNAQEVTEGNVTYVYNATKGYWESSEVSSGASIDVLADMAALIAKTGMSNGDQAFVTGNNNLYIYSGSGWYKVATVQNDSPTAITGVSGTYSLAIDGTPTVITAVSTDPDGFPLTWTYSTSGLGSIATISQADNVFTITPSTTEADAGTFTLTINTTDGVNGAVSTTTNLTLEFMVIVTNSKYTTLLVTAVDTSDNNNITDSSASSHNINVFGPDAGAFSPYRHGGYSTYFDGSGDYIGVGSAIVPTAYDTDYTIEMWIYPTTTGSREDIFNQYAATASGRMAININSDATISFFQNGLSPAETISSAISANNWYHLSVVNSSGTRSFYVNGSLIGTATGTVSMYGGNTEIGRLGDVGSNYFTGYITDVRVVNGTAITPASGGPTKRLTAVSGTGYSTSLLTCHLPYISDGSSNGHSVTGTGNVSTKPFGPYDYNEYSASTNGGSVYFDGSDYCTIADSEDFEFGSGDFTVECWVYMTAYEGTGFNMFLHKGGNNSNAWHFDYKNVTTELRFLPYVSNVNATITATTTLNLNQWYHVAAVRNGNTIVLYKNGKAVSSTAYSLTIDNTADAIHIGQRAHLNDRRLTGYLSDIRINKSAVYTSDFTVPTSTVSSTGSTLHIKGTDASIIDKSQAQGSNLKLVGNTTGSTTQVKFADTKSIFVPSAGYVAGNASTANCITIDEVVLTNTESFTYEFWMKLSSTTQTASPYGHTDNNRQTQWNEGGVTGNIMLYMDGYIHQTVACYSAAEASNWMHVAYSFDQPAGGNNFKLFINGTQRVATFLGTWIYINTIGSGYSGHTYPINGYIQDFRVTKGLARYTANFTPPTEPLKG